MHDSPLYTLRLQVSERTWKPVLAPGATEPPYAIWLEEVLALSTEFIGVILLAILGGVICLFNHFVFRSRVPRREDMQTPSKKWTGNNT